MSIYNKFSSLCWSHLVQGWGWLELCWALSASSQLRQKRWGVVTGVMLGSVVCGRRCGSCRQSGGARESVCREGLLQEAEPFPPHWARHLWQSHQRGRWEVLLQLPIPADQLPPPRPPRALQTVLYARFPKEKEGESPTFLPRGSCWEPARLHLERLLLLEGLGEVEVVEGGHCSTCPEECLRLPALKIFPDSPWEVVIDVGKCSDPTYSAGMKEGELLSLPLGIWEGALLCDQHQCPSSGHPVC
ncbi:uncharacterized protein LOC104696965 isoform X1 [Corvus cornix cornix]|uniref:uncharacterized protein LOC104696965 isoform X1 n=1 Tax=Corvus cornix cornix TaxID=932674 RepID=UPI00194E2DEF|nr:uncharacterized protein LOC104696965 isoform X1 [Corvus cornix cornix]